MADKKYPSGIPVRESKDLLPGVFQTENNTKFFSGALDPWIQPGTLDKISGYIGQKYGKTFSGNDIYLDSDETLRSRYQLEPGVIVNTDETTSNFYDYIDLKNQVKFFGNLSDRDDKVTLQDHYSWNPPVSWDKLVNYREYFWMPLGIPVVQVQGQSRSIQSTYSVRQATGSSYVFTPDSLTNNPDIILYRGQTYNFRINSPSEPFYIRTNYDTGSLNYDPNETYAPGQLAVFEGKLWRAKVLILPEDGSSISIDSQDWELIDENATESSFDYSGGITNNGIENGTLTFTVPNDAPDILYYQSGVDTNRLGKFLISDIEENTQINVESEILGKATYTSSNNIVFSNGLMVEFTGTVTPEKYSEGVWLVEGVGETITLTKFSELIPTKVSSDNPEILFDNAGFDTQPFDDADAYPANKDYIIIRKDSDDRNPWSRYNRWFHRSVIEYAYQQNGSDFDSAEAQRAKRPIIEFLPNLKLYNHGAIAKQTVDYIDTFTTDVFSDIEGQSGYSVDGEFLFEGARILVVNDTDILANNKIYEVRFIAHNGRRQIHLAETSDSDSFIEEGVLVRRGQINAGLMFHFDGTNWISSQSKSDVNQAPLFDMFDENSVSFSDNQTYPVSTFVGSKILSYSEGTSVVDNELGFSIDYLNIDNVGDIQFVWNIESETFSYIVNKEEISKNSASGYYRLDNEFDNGWIKTNTDFIQPILDYVSIEEPTDTVNLTTVDWDEFDRLRTQTPNQTKIIFYVNGEYQNLVYTREQNTFTFAKSFNANDILSIKLIADLEPITGYYQIPVGLEKNPLNQKLQKFTLGQASDHIRSSLDFNNEFEGNIPGNSNLRDINNTLEYSTRFMKHEGVAPVAIALLCNKDINLIKSINYCSDEYGRYKNNFIKKSEEIDFDDTIPNLVDKIVTEITKNKDQDSAFSESDMFGTGAFTKIEYIVEDPGITTFSLQTNFDLETLSDRAVYVYLNDSQLTHGIDYAFDNEFGFVRITKTLSKTDRIEIREYVSSNYSYMPPTPSSLGIWKKYTPQKYLDSTYIVPQMVIQGHDGSKTIAFNDYRDDLLLELELRIYNNIKNSYDSNIFDLDLYIGGYYKNGIYTKDELDNIIVKDYIKWSKSLQANDLSNSYLSTENTFTYTYSSLTDYNNETNLPGWWRGIYNWVYGTDRPHTHPWEIQGFSEKPSWWEDEYGPAPYTSGNLILWEDIKEGIIRQGPFAGQYEKIKRETILKHIPVDEEGKLLSPLDSGFAKNFDSVNFKGDFKFGDESPVESAWRSSSDYPFSIVSALSILSPFKFISSNFDFSQTQRNRNGQLVTKNTNEFNTLNDFITANKLTIGLINFIKPYVKSLKYNVNSIDYLLNNLDVRLSSKLSGFVDKEQTKFLLDSKNPNSPTGSVFIPNESFEIRFNKSIPVKTVVYSAVIVEKASDGWILRGYNYDDIDPYFNYHEPVKNLLDPAFNVGGVSEDFIEWTANRVVSNGTIVRFNNEFYRATSTHTISDTFDNSLYVKLPSLPFIGGVTALRRKKFDRRTVKRLNYGTKLFSIQDVVDFLQGYGDFLESNGFKFENFDPENITVSNWDTAAQEFLFWTTQDWNPGALISLSPGAKKMEIQAEVGVVDDLLDSFYNYNVLRSNGLPLEPEVINVERNFQNFKISVEDSINDGVYFLKIYYVLKEHVVLFNDKTVFNDVLYDKTSGYKQERIKLQGFRTIDWDGDYTSPGFIFDNVQINAWIAFKDYRLGDIVSYRAKNYVAIETHTSIEEFDETKWDILDSEPTKRLVPNFDYKINQFEDYYDVDSQGLDITLKNLGRHSLGYQPREYLQNLAEDSVTQFRLYQGFIKEKGTINAINKLFDKIETNTNSDGLDLNEEWAIKIGEFGGIDQIEEVEFSIENNQLELNPQPISVGGNTDEERIIKLNQSDFNILPVPYRTDLNTVSYYSEPLKTAGYVKTDQIEKTVPNKDDILDLDIETFFENDHIWITFDKQSWTVLRYNILPILNVIEFEYGFNDTSALIEFNRNHTFDVGDIVGLKDIENFSGFWKIASTTSRTITVEVNPDSLNGNPNFDPSTLNRVYKFTEARVSDYDLLNVESAALLANGSRIFVDNNGNNLWEVIQKQRQYLGKELTEYGTTSPINAGTEVLYIPQRDQLISSIPGSSITVVYRNLSTGLQVEQILLPSDGFADKVVNTFGEALAISPDGRFLAIGSPKANQINSPFKGDWNQEQSYLQNDIVLYEGKLWKAITNVPADSSTINIKSELWEPAESIPAFSNAFNQELFRQGMITIYEYSANQYNIVGSFVSPRPTSRELFGSKLQIAKNNNTYIMAVGAPGSLSGKGRVYLYEYDGNSWKHFNNKNYVGVYDPADVDKYGEGTIVYYDNSLYRSTVESPNDSTINLNNSTQWIKIDPVATENSLPTSVSLEQEDSTLITGILSDDQLAEMVKSGDAFGYSLTMSTDATVLAIGAPNSDNQFFTNYKGEWRSDIEYTEGDVVKYQNSYHKLENKRFVSADLIIEGYLYEIIELGTTDWNQVAGTTTTSENLTPGLRYRIKEPANSDFTIVGATSNLPGTQFTATGTTTGIGTADVIYEIGDIVVSTGNGFSGTGKAWESTDSTVKSYNQEPVGYPWENVGDSTGTATGKVFVYNLENGVYNLKQTISSQNIETDAGLVTVIDSGDEFGYDIDIDSAGSTLVASSPKSDINFTNQGSAYIFKLNSDNSKYLLKQELRSYEEYPNEYFGHRVKISDITDKVVVGAKNAQYVLPTRFDSQQTTFDDGVTNWFDQQGAAGAVYVYDLKDETYHLTEKLYDELSLNENFGYSLDVSGNNIAVGSPQYKAPSITNGRLVFTGRPAGIARIFTKDASSESWNTLTQQEPVVDINKIKQIEIYDPINSEKIQTLDYLDHAKLKIDRSADQEIKFKVPYDPAIYSKGTDSQVVQTDLTWTDKHVGELWWDLSKAKWIYYEQGDLTYKAGNWNRLAEGASIDIYEWVESKLLPSQWAEIADTNEGLSQGVSGQPLHSDDTVYSERILFNSSTQQPTETRYYYWVKNKTNLPNEVTGRRISSSSVTQLIENPKGFGDAFVALAAQNAFLLYNFENIINEDTALVNIEYYKDNKQNQKQIHFEYEILTENLATSLPSPKLETKWIDSLVGYDQAGNKVPDDKLPQKQKYGVKFRPRQSMFINRFDALKIVVERINTILLTRPYATFIDFTDLNSIDPIPSALLNLYDRTIETLEDLETVGTVRLKQAQLRANVVDGEITSIDITDPGFGYKVAPVVEFEGNGIDAEAITTIDSQGRINSVQILNTGKNYASVICKVRRFSVLVQADSNSNGDWSIYSWDDVRKVFFKSRSQSFNTPRYWSYKDWYAEGINDQSPVRTEIQEVYELPAIDSEINLNSIIRIKEYGVGGWSLFRKIDNTGESIENDYELIGKQNGTIEIDNTVYDPVLAGVGYDRGSTFDSNIYDNENSIEIRNILLAIKKEIFVGNNAVEWNNLFFACIRQAFTEQVYVDWAFKTSFIKAIHDVGNLRQKLNYKNDNLESYRKYVEEVKPFRTTIREFLSKYKNQDISSTPISDFDLPSTYDTQEGKIVPVNLLSSQVQTYPWKWWFDNQGYSITDIEISDSGSTYLYPPKVIIEGDGTGATAKAYISNGKVNSIVVTNEGQGYSFAPNIILAGGNSDSSKKAKATAILGNAKFRTFSVNMKFDRISKNGTTQNFDYVQELTATGNSSVFNLNYPPSRNRSSTKVFINNLLVLQNEYSINYFYQNGELKARIIFDEVPLLNDQIRIEFEKNIELLDSVSRINRYYEPDNGMQGKDLEQLMTGIDYGGVQIQGTTFDVTGGWDALPWFTDNWDSVETSSDFYVVVDGSTTFVTLPYTPSEGQRLNIYYKPFVVVSNRTIDNLQYSSENFEPNTVRLDDPNFVIGNDNSNLANKNAVMPTFIGDGSTNTIEIGQFISLNEKDTLIFRPEESDGSVIVNDENILDTNLSGGTLSNVDNSYTTATGFTVDEIIANGGEFNNPYSTPATEENLPGQVLDSFSLKVFQRSTNDSSQLKTNTILSDGIERFYPIGQTVLRDSSVLINVDGVNQTLGTDYLLNIETNTVEFLSAVSQGSLIEIISIGIGGLGILDYKEFLGDGETFLFLTAANFDETNNVFVTLNGAEIDVGYVISEEFLDTTGKTLLQFGTPPLLNDVIKVVVLSNETDVDTSEIPIVRINEQNDIFTGSRSFNINNFIELPRDSSLSSIVVEINDLALQGVDTNYAIYDGTNNTFVLGVDPVEGAGVIINSNINVYINGTLATLIQDYTFEGTTKTLEVNPLSLNVGDEIRIENNFRTQYSLQGNNLTIDDEVSLSPGDNIKITWFNEYPSLDLLSDEYVGGKIRYKLLSNPISVDYVWVYLNGVRQTQDKDYYVIENNLYLKQKTNSSDLIKVLLFSNKIYKEPNAFEISQDMLNIDRFNRYSINSFVLDRDLNYYDEEIILSSSDSLYEPEFGSNKPGTVVINNERIEYFRKQGNILSQLRRGVNGTAIKELHTKDSKVVDVSLTESLPYKEDHSRTDFVSDGSSNIIGPLDYTPIKTDYNNWFAETIPEGYGQCDYIEVFVGGRRLRKTPITIYDESLSSNSPSGDKIIESEFAVSGEDNFVRLTEVPAAGTRITIIRKTGQYWYDRGDQTISSGVTLIDNQNPIAKFIAEKTTELPE